MQGALVWNKGGKLRLALDRADLWDQRPMKGLHRPEFSYKWVQQQVAKKDYKLVQEYFDHPYDREPAPTKIPGAALELPLPGNTNGVKAILDIQHAESIITFGNNSTLKILAHAKADFGLLRYDGPSNEFVPILMAPQYAGKATTGGDVVGGDDLTRLGYTQGSVQQNGNTVTYYQQGWGGFGYRVTICWRKISATATEAIWRITSGTGNIAVDTAYLQTQLRLGYAYHRKTHVAWWASFWAQSKIQVPDSLLQRQWYLEQYKFGSASHRGAPPISLQAVWTADNGRIPPWKGDYHHDLNTQLSYWPAYSANHLEEALSYLDHLDANKENYRRYTRQYFGVSGLNAPGVTTLDGTEMGGWIQYALSPTVSCWLAHHYYLQWRYSMNRTFLEQRAYPWLKETAEFVENITVLDSAGRRKLPISSSPEINDNSLNAWFSTNTNYDLALMKFACKAAAEMAGVLRLKSDVQRWTALGNSFGDFALSANHELMFARSLPYTQSHRHFSHLMAIHPLGLLHWEHGDKAQRIISQSLRLLDSVGPSQWVGYSYAWQANLKARVKDGEGAARALQIFAKAFCSPNSFHLNGDQTNEGYSSFRYRPFTLEGNFAFAAGLQEMLLQSYAGYIEVMPAVPQQWQEIAFDKLRTEGAFLVSARKSTGTLAYLRVEATVDGPVALKMPPGQWKSETTGTVSGLREENGMLRADMKVGAMITMRVGQ
jgi:hypothetical protein